MALSNWDLLAFGADGKPCDGNFQAFNGTSIEIYKNRVHVNNAKMWQENEGSFVSPVIASIDHGDINVGGVNIVAKRAPQNGVFVFVEATHYDESLDKSLVKFFAGIGCSAYDDPSKRMAKAMGVDLTKWVIIASGGGWNGENEYISLCCRNKATAKLKDFYLDATPENKALESKFVGVTASTYRHFLKWLKNVFAYRTSDKDAAKWLRRVEAAEPKRFNQGDAYFIGANKAATKIGGNRKKTIAHQIIDNM